MAARERRTTKLTGFIKRYHYAVAAALLVCMALLGLGSMRGDSAIVDEVAHISAGYGYVRYGDYRLNPEHPPLVKDLAALPLLGLRLSFPLNTGAWQKDVNGQWEVGWHFLYHDGNNADQILFWSRLPVLLLTLLFGAVLYEVSRRYLGRAAALVILALFTFEPNIIAHARFVTTDAGAAATMFGAVASYVLWLRRPTWRWWLLATATFFVAQVTKFSAILLIPFYGALLLWAFVTEQAGSFKQEWKRYLGGTLLLGLSGFVLVWLFYIPHTMNMPAGVQDALIRGSLVNPVQKPLVSALTRLNDLPLGKPLAQYLLGVFMVFTRVSGGNTTYFLGEVTNQSFKWYFPVTYGIKTPLPMLAAMVLTLISGAWLALRRSSGSLWQAAKSYSQRRPLEVAGLGFIAFYSFISISGNLNLGIRHLLPIIPWVCFVVGAAATRLWRRSGVVVRAALGLLLASYVALTVAAYPHFVAYFNQLIGGATHADKYVSDSSIDWGQDLKRLKTYVDAHPEISHISVDYFGGGEPRYYFCKRAYDATGALIASSAGYDCTGSKYVEWHAQNGLPHGYLAVSETYLENDRYQSKLRGDTGYTSLYNVKPLTTIGHSIFIYKLP